MGSYIPFDGSDLPLSDFAGLPDLRPAPQSLYDYMDNPTITISHPGHGYFVNQLPPFIDPATQHDAYDINHFSDINHTSSISLSNDILFPQADEYQHQSPVFHNQYRPLAVDPAPSSQHTASTTSIQDPNGWSLNSFSTAMPYDFQTFLAQPQLEMLDTPASFGDESNEPRERGGLQYTMVGPASDNTAVSQQSSEPSKSTATTRIRPSTGSRLATKWKVKSATKGDKKFVRRGKSKYPEIEHVIGKLQKAADMLNKRNDLEPAAFPHPPATNGLYFTSAQEAEVVNKIAYWKPPTNDDTIPTTQARVEAWVVKLLGAMRNNEGCLRTNDDKESSATVRRWGEEASYYPPTALEAASWKMIALGLDIHQQGWLDAIPEPKLREDIYYSMCFTFEERMNLVVRVLEISKSTCEDLIKGNRFHEIVGCPQVVFERVWGNNNSNRHKANLLGKLKPKKEALKTVTKPAEFSKLGKRQRSTEDTDDNEDDSGLSDSDAKSLSTHRKKQRRTASSALADVAGLVDNIAPTPDTDIDVPYKTDEEFTLQSPVSTTETPAEPIALAAFSKKTAATAQPVSEKEPKSKRSIKDVEDKSKALGPVKKKAKTCVRAKASVKGKGKSKAASATAAAEDDSEFEQPSRSKGKAKTAPLTPSTRLSKRLRTYKAPSAALGSNVVAIGDPDSSG